MSLFPSIVLAIAVFTQGPPAVRATSRQTRPLVDTPAFGLDLVRAHIVHWFCHDHPLSADTKIQLFEHPKYFYGVLVQVGNDPNVIVEPLFMAIDRADGSLLLGGRLKTTTPKDIADCIHAKYGNPRPQRPTKKRARHAK